MGEPEERIPTTPKAEPSSGPSSSSRILLVAEPDSLLRWSLATYFGALFQVRAVGTAQAGMEVLDKQAVSAMIVSDALDSSGLVQMELQALALNPNVCIIRIVTSLRSARTDSYATATLEKPFELSALAKLLTIPTANRST
ncbi:MAG: hypothetical protein ACE5D3_05935 [Candidatus Binatia bacterium]